MDKVYEENGLIPAATENEAESAFEKQINCTTIPECNAQQPLFDFLPIPSPRVPAKDNTHIGRAAEMFMRGDYLTHPGFIALSGSWRLAAIVGELKRYGWPIDVYRLDNRVAVYYVSEASRRDLRWG
ncbi:hypothetical protein [uncultured Zhongshania sp.]|uniref:hypothetical protein n=1 Tax=uncultured Zhongshania sp. TaxID=1642288 RepID=UPI0025EE1D4B|nr:hypothetical protein [uncultured Zhongshania sp.]